MFLLENPDPQGKIDVSAAMKGNRNEFDVRKFVAQHGFKPERAGGAHFWRETWDPTVSDIYRTILRERWSTLTSLMLIRPTTDSPEPRYGRPPKVDRYEEVKRVKRYI